MSHSKPRASLRAGNIPCKRSMVTLAWARLSSHSPTPRIAPGPLCPIGEWRLTCPRPPSVARAHGCVTASLESTSPPRGGSFPGMLL